PRSGSASCTGTTSARWRSGSSPRPSSDASSTASRSRSPPPSCCCSSSRSSARRASRRGVGSAGAVARRRLHDRAHACRRGARGLYAEALAAYRRAMGAAPDDADAKFNHEFVEKKMADLKKKLEEQQKQQQEQQNRENQDQAKQDHQREQQNQQPDDQQQQQ